MPAGTAPNISTWDVLSQPYRPGLADFNGAALENDAENPPNASTMPTAELLNTISKLVASACATIPNAIISVSAAAAIVGVQSPKSGVVAVNFTVTHTGNGDVSITWPAGFFPASQAQPTVSLNEALVATHTYSIGAVSITNGVRVTCQLDGARTDMAFTVMVR